MTPVTDPALLAQLNGSGTLTPVTDPGMLAQLNGSGFDRSPGGLYHYVLPTGQEVFSKNPPPAGAKPFVPVTAATAGTNSENFDAGVGKAFVDMGRGARQLYAEGADYVDPSGNRSPAVQQEINEARQTDAPLMSTKAGLAGNIAGNVAAVAPFVPAGVLSAAAVGAGTGALQPVADGDSTRARNVATGAATGAAGQLVGGLLRRVAQPVTNALTPHEAQSVSTLQAAGVPLNVAQRTGSTFLSRLSSGLRDSPVTAATAEASDAASQEAVQRGLIATMGENAPAATQTVMSNARTRIGGVMDAVAARNPVQFDTNLAGDLSRISSNATSDLTPDAAQIIQNRVGQIVDMARQGNGVINGDAWQNLHSALGRITSAPQVGPYASQLREALRDALSRSASDPNDVTALATARQQYQAMKQIQGALDADGSGNISIKKLSNALMRGRNANQGAYGDGNQDLVQLAQAARTILPDAVPNSGTPSRAAAMMLPSVGAETAAQVLEGKPVEAAKTLAFGFAPKYAAPFVFSQGGLGNYLTNGVTNPLVRGLLQAPSTSLGRIGVQTLPNQFLPRRSTADAASQ